MTSDAMPGGSTLTACLPEGCEVGLPPVRAAWGAWFVGDGDGGVEPVPGGHGYAGDAQHAARLRRWLADGAFEAALAALAFRLRAGGLHLPAQLLLRDDGEGVVVATVASPYVRLNAWRHDDVALAA